MKSFLRKIKRIILYAGLKKSDFLRIRKDLAENNRRSLVFCTAMACFLMMAMFVLSFFMSAVMANRWLYFIMVFVVAILLAVLKFCPLKGRGVLICTYFLWSLFMGMGIYLGVIASPDRYSVTYIALVLAIPLLFSDLPIRIGAFIGLYAIAFIVCATFFKDPAVRGADIVHVLLFSTVSVITSYNSQRITFQRYLLSFKLRVRSETDLLTGTRNRNAFETAKKQYEAICKQSVACVYIDANGLHELNNIEGHHRGDEMLRTIAEGLCTQFDIENVFRIGGDEFVAFAVDEELTSVEQKMNVIRKTIEEQGYYAATGFSILHREELDIDALITQAEKKMYEDKMEYYACRGEDKNDLCCRKTDRT